LDERALSQATAGFGGFRGLPHSWQNPYWQLFTPRGPDTIEVSGGEGTEIEVLSKDAPALGVPPSVQPSPMDDDDEDLEAVPPVRVQALDWSKLQE